MYLAPADRHLTIERGCVTARADGRSIHYLVSAADPLFASAAEALAGRVVAVVLTGLGRDGTDGARSIKAAGGTVIARE